MTDHQHATRILETICDRFATPVADVQGVSRKADIVRVRHAAMWAVRHRTPLSYPKIGRLFNRDHTTVMHAVASIDGARKINPGLRQLLDEIE